MVIYCVAFGCKNEQDYRRISFHGFPFKRPDILKLWIKAVRRKNWAPSKTSKLCGEHFLPTDYIVRPGCTSKLLKPDAVPSVFSYPKHLLPKIVEPRRKIRKVELSVDVHNENVSEHTISPTDVNLPSTSRSAQVRTLIDRETQTVSSGQDILLRRKLKTLKQKLKRREVKISNMKEVIHSISESDHSNENLEEVLQKHFQGLPLELVLLQKGKDEGVHPGQRRYSPLMKQFAHTLYFYSPKAYNFLSKQFVLPNGITIRKWLTSLNCHPGILGEVLEFLRREVHDKPYFKNCALIMDAMSIRKQVLWDNSVGRYFGNVDYGGLIDTDFDMPATEALFLQIVSYTNNFKCPVAYFLTTKADANLQTQIIMVCLRSLYEVGITVRSITSDGTNVNISTYNNLGCNIEYDKLQTYFDHPCDPSVKVYCILDVCHMLKLARNCFAEKNLTSSSGKISWNYIKALDDIQSAEKLKLANSLSSHHVNYKNKIMNVRLAAQTISSGVADAIEYLQKSSVTGFEDSNATVEFLRTIDRIFDILNCRNPFGKGYKAPIRLKSMEYFKDIFFKTKNYFGTLEIDGIPLLQHMRKTFALGFILTMESTLGLARDLLSLDESPLAYFLTYKYSQDHLEIFFSCIRSRGGWNNNPNTQQLKWALRQLLYRNSVTASVSANCSDLESYCTPAFEFRSEGRQIKDINEATYTNDITNLISCLGNQKLSDFQENVVYYISGYVVRNLINTTTCNHCVEILLYRDSKSTDHSYTAPSEAYKSFTNTVNRGGLLYASDIVYKILNFAEKQIRFLLESGYLLASKINLKQTIINSIIKHFIANVGLFKPKHPVVQEFLVEESHEIQIVRKITTLYLKCRMHHHSRQLNLELQGKNAPVRQKLTKLVLFSNC